MHKVKVKGILSSSNGMNIYRGCTHECIYCDSRSLCYQMPHDFEDIEVKENALELLEDSLKRKRKKCMIATGAMCDPYIAYELKSETMRKALLLIEKYDFGAAVQTKSTGVLRDLDVLKRINEKTKAVVQMTLTTYDEDLCKIIEPNVSTTKERFEALKIFRDNNIPTVVWLSPILPFLNDTEENLKGILDYCIKAKVKGILCFGMGLTIRDGNREYLYENFDKHFTGLKEKYIKTYGNAYEVNSPNNYHLMKIFRETCEKNNIIYGVDKVFNYLKTFEDKNPVKQLSLFD